MPFQGANVIWSQLGCLFVSFRFHFLFVFVYCCGSLSRRAGFKLPQEGLLFSRSLAPCSLLTYTGGRHLKSWDLQVPEFKAVGQLKRVMVAKLHWIYRRKSHGGYARESRRAAGPLAAGVAWRRLKWCMLSRVSSFDLAWRRLTWRGQCHREWRGLACFFFFVAWFDEASEAWMAVAPVFLFDVVWCDIIWRGVVNIANCSMVKLGVVGSGVN